MKPTFIVVRSSTNVLDKRPFFVQRDGMTFDTRRSSAKEWKTERGAQRWIDERPAVKQFPDIRVEVV